MFKIYDGRNQFYQWDIDRKVVVNDKTVNEVHFCNRTDDCSLVCEVYDLDGLRVADVPNILLQNNWRINVYAYDSNYTKYNEVFEVIRRTKPADYVYTETEIKNYDDLVDRIDQIEQNSVTDENVAAAIEKYFEDNDIQVDLTGYATETYVDQAIEEIELIAGPAGPAGSSGVYVGVDQPTDENVNVWIDPAGEDADLSAYALKTDIPDVSKYQTADQVEAAISSALGAIGVAEEDEY